MRNMKCYDVVYDYIINQITTNLDSLDIPVYYKRQKFSLRRCWANRIYKDTLGTIHDHGKSTVLIVYYNVPKDSSSLVFIDPKHSDKLFQEESIIPKDEKLSIEVNTGMCVLHDGRILHAVTKHGSTIPRDVLVFEFDSIFL